MRMDPPPLRLLAAGVLSIALGACGEATDKDGSAQGDSLGSGGESPSTSGGMGSDGSGHAGGTGGSPQSSVAATGGVPTGGTSPGGTGGTSVGAGSGGTSSAVASGTGGATQGSTGGRAPGAGGTGGASSGAMPSTGGTSEGGAGAGAGGSGGSSSMAESGAGGVTQGRAGGAGTDPGSAGGSSSMAESGAAGLSQGDTGGANGGGGETGGSSSMAGAGTGGFTGTCTESRPTGTTASGSGPHAVVVETNADAGINEGTIYRPADLGGDEKYPIFVWGEGACSRNGLANASAMAEIASHGYFVVADGTPNGSGNIPMDRSNLPAMAAPLIGYIDWAIAENEKPCSAYYHSLDPANIASNGFSCGGLMAQATVTDPRITTWGVTSSGMAGADQAFYDEIHTPVFFVEGGPSDTAYDGAREGYESISALGVPVLWFSKDIGHGGDLLEPDGGDFTKLNLAWLNWWLKGDETATGKGLLIGPGCPYCTDSAWDVMSENLP